MSPSGDLSLTIALLSSTGPCSGYHLFADERHGAQKRGNIVSQLGHSLKFLSEHLK